jgi:protein-tyrosine sulfotransferase
MLDAIQQKELDRWKNNDWIPEEEDSSDYISYDKIVAICGSGRSGTTLLRVMLDTHQEIASGPESLLFLPVSISIGDLAEKFNLNEGFLTNLKEECESRAEFIDRFKELYLVEANKSIWADKTSRNIHRIGYILTHFPNAKIIHVVRNGKDTICSLRRHRKRKLEGGEIKLTGYTMPLENCVQRWVNAIADTLPFRDYLNYYEVKYEDLVEQPKRTLQSVCRAIGVDYVSDMLNFHKVPRNFRHFIQNIEATKPIFISSIGRWKKELSHQERDYVETQIEEFERILGYAQ